MAKILANDGIDKAGKSILEAAGIEVVTDKVAQENLPEALKNFDGILVRSATTVRKDLIDACPNLKLIGRAGVGMDNIDVAYAREKGLKVINTPEASSESVAELVFAHLFTMARFLHDANRNMPGSDSKERFNELKKNYSAGIELKGKTLGIIGFGNIGQAVARMGIGLGMTILPFKLRAEDVKIEIDFFRTVTNAKMVLTMKCVPFEQLLAESDFITLHVPFPKGAPSIIGKREFEMMKKSAFIVNTARGGAVNESDLLHALDNGTIAAAGLDVFEGEPLIKEALRNHPKVSLSPHIGGSTAEAQQRIGIEIAEKIVAYFSSKV
ncbi:MAG: D-2-hydroxyacid dehydrogenase [Bacteroidetes bacterium]|nr:D-2-hydroxyacid dehydrogenase [Bacteroidota bacterium]MBL0096791.1 D-2-hydroxyacid dehydrogenase [Bacteroidota bacterium]